MNKKTLESMVKQTNQFRRDILNSRGDIKDGNFDERGAWMLILTFINEVSKYEIEKLKLPSTHT